MFPNDEWLLTGPHATLTAHRVPAFIAASGSEAQGRGAQKEDGLLLDKDFAREIRCKKSRTLRLSRQSSLGARHWILMPSFARHFFHLQPTSQQQRPNGRRPTGPDGKPLPFQNGQPRPMQPNMMDPGLRQRTGLGVTNAQGVPVGQGRPMGMAPGQQQPHPQQPPNSPRGPQGPYGPQGPNFNNGMSPQHSPSMERHWYDKIVDVLVGDEGPDTKYALICGQCYAHNGLALPQEIEDIRKSP